MKLKLIIFILFFFLFLSSGYFFILTFFSENIPIHFRYIYLFPLNFLILNFFCIKFYNYYKFYPINIIILLLIYLKFSVTPFLMYLTDYVSIISIDNINLITHSIFLSIYELITIIFLLIFYSKNNENFQDPKIGSNYFFLNKSGFLIILVFFLFLTISYIFNSTINTYAIKTIFDKDVTKNISNIINLNSLNLLSRVSFTLFNVIYPIFIFLTTITLFHILKKNNKENFFYFILIIFILSINLIFINTTNSKFQIFIYLTSYIIILFNYFKKFNTYFIPFIFLIVILSFYQIYSLKSDIILFRNSNFVEILSQMFQAYIPNITNLAVGLKIEISLYQKINSIMGDLYSTIPFRNTLFGFNGTGNDFGRYWSSANTGYFLNAQIAPNLSYGVLYLGYLLSPIFSFVMIYFSIYFQKIMMSSKNIFEFSLYCLLSVQLAFSVFMYNYLTFLLEFFVFFLPIIITLKIIKNYEGYN